MISATKSGSAVDGKTIRVDLVYRNYQRLRPHYFSFANAPHADLELYIPPPKPFLSRLHRIYRAVGNRPVIREFIAADQRFVFSEDRDSPADMFYYVGMLPQLRTKKPFVVDIEHIYALMNFTQSPEKMRAQVVKTLSDDLCRAILPWSAAADQTMKAYLQEDYEGIAHKVKVVYPAVTCNLDRYQNGADHSIISADSERFNLLFVGRNPYRKGLEETLLAFAELSSEYKQLYLYVVCDSPRQLVRRFQSNPAVRFFQPNLVI